MRRGRVKIDLDLKRLDQLAISWTAPATGSPWASLTASLVVGSSIIMTVEGALSYSALLFSDCWDSWIAFFNSLWIIFSIWRSGKH